jgi:malto-oligosyltrehalose trehalohydrolase
MEAKVRRRHRMPFGAELTATGEVRFRLWAPAARRVEVLLADEPVQALGMEALPGGWFALTTGAARTGSLYRLRIDGQHEVADPASRWNPHGVHGPSAVLDPSAYAWDDEGWQAPPWHSAVIYELHVGTFSAAGTYAGVIAHLPHLARLGVTAIELMPLAAFPGQRGWGYDGVLPYAPHAPYGTPAELKTLVAAAHRHGLAVLLDVVYNHFGPEGNYLHRYAPQFFNAARTTPWGAAINFDGPGSRPVRDFFIHNALYWLEEYHFDGLRLDAVGRGHQLRRPGQPPGARLLHPQRALLARGVPLRRAAARRRARHPRRQRAAHRQRDRAGGALGPGTRAAAVSHHRELRQRPAVPRRGGGADDLRRAVE